jgi:hypothetical protein
MELLKALRNEELKLARQLASIRNAIAALNGSFKHATAGPGRAKRKLSTESRAKMRRAAKARWAKIKAKKN